MAFQMPLAQKAGATEARRPDVPARPQSSTRYCVCQQNKRARKNAPNKSVSAGHLRLRPLQAVAERAQTSISASSETTVSIVT